jgi:hypothetical protein
VQQIKHRLAGGGHLHRPVTHGGPTQIRPKSAELFLLPVKRQRVTELGGENMGQKAGGGDALVNDLSRRRSDLDRSTHGLHPFALPAGVFGPDVAYNLDHRRDDVELLRDILADPAQSGATATGLLRLVDIVNHLDSWQFRRQWLSDRASAGYGPGC